MKRNAIHQVATFLVLLASAASLASPCVSALHSVRAGGDVGGNHLPAMGGSVRESSPVHYGPRWMEAMWTTISNRTLLELTLPGTHDSGAYNLTTELQPGDSGGVSLDDLIKLAEALGIPVEDLITPWARAQDRSFLGQLEGGIRYIDFRAGWNGTNWNTFHFEVGTSVQNLLGQIRAFLASNTHEVVVIEVSHTASPNVTTAAEAHLATMINTTLGEYLWPRSGGFVPISEMVSQNRRALVTLDNSAYAAFEGIWAGNTIQNSYADSDKLDKMMPYNDEKVKEFQSFTTPDTLYKISWTLTPAADCILKGFLPDNPHSLIELADTAAPHLKPWASGYLSKGMPLANIVIIDHFETSPIVSVCQASSTLVFPRRTSGLPLSPSR